MLQLIASGKVLKHHDEPKKDGTYSGMFSMEVRVQTAGKIVPRKVSVYYAYWSEKSVKALATEGKYVTVIAQNVSEVVSAGGVTWLALELSNITIT